jgi:hypothetical protein
MNLQPDISWWKTNWPYVVIVLVICRNFVNNLLTNCPFLKANKGMEVIQGIFNAAVQTVVKSKGDQNPN